jgi:hypothetical protein
MPLLLYEGWSQKLLWNRIYAKPDQTAPALINNTTITKATIPVEFSKGSIERGGKILDMNSVENKNAQVSSLLDV